MIKYNVVIPCAEKDISFLPKVVFYIRKNLRDASTIVIITKSSCINKAKRIIHDNYLYFMDENDLIPELTFAGVNKVLTERIGKYSSLTGWYFQQFLKYAYAFTPNASDYYLTWDADTLPISEIKFFTESGNPIFTKKYEYHKPYFETIEKLLGYSKVADFSFIAEHMMFSSAIVKDLIRNIDAKKNAGNNWVEKILYAPDTLNGNSFSEFETYGTFCFVKYPNIYKTQQLNTFRCGGMIRGRNISDKQLNRLSIDLHTISFEYVDFPFPYNVSWYIQKMRKKIYNFLNV